MTSTVARASLVVPQQGNPKPDLWEEALNALSAEDRKQFADSSTSSHEVLQKVQEATKNTKEACVAKGWRVYKKKNGEYVKLRYILEKLSVWVESAIKIVDLGVSFDKSGHAALPWGVVKFIVTMGKSNIELFSNIVEQIESISSLIARYAVIEKLYLDGASEATIGLRGSITELYAAILTYLARAKLYFSENDLRQIGRGLIEAARKHYDAAKLSETEIHNWMRIVDRELDRETAKLMIKNYEGLERILHDFNKPITRMAVQMDDLHDNLNREERTKIFHWLSKIDYGRHHDDLSKHLLPDTGQWLFDSQQFIEWGQSNLSSILWIHGIPGSGKTRLVSRVIDVMSDESTSKKSPIAFFYCARSTAEPERGKPAEVLGAILKQLCSSEPDEPIRNPIATEYASRFRKADYDYSRIRKLSVEDCTGLILEVTKDNAATIIVDALDECEEETRYELLEALDNIIANSVEVVKVVVSSRDDVDITLHLEHCNNISINASRNQGDIARFVLSEVDRLISKKLLLHGRVHKKLKKQITETLTNGAQGMFRWVAMSLETLQKIKFRQDFENCLGRLPSKLSELYDIIHSEIISSEDDQTAKYSRLAAIKTLKWLLCAQRLLTVEELAAAIQLPYNENVDSSSGSDDSEETDDKINDAAIDSSSSSDGRNQKDIETKTWIEDNVIRLCRNLVVVDSERTDSEQLDKERKIFRFAHQSVREYLLTRKEYTNVEQHALVVERCLGIYEVETSPDPAEPNLTRQNEILKPYARGYWPVHYKYLDDLGSLEPRRKLRSFIIQDSTKSSPYMRWVDDMMNGFAIEDDSKPSGVIARALGLVGFDPLPDRLAYALAEPYTYLSMICAFGLSSLLNELEVPSVELNQLLKLRLRKRYRQNCTTLLTIASDQGHAQIVQVLLDKGVAIDVNDELCVSPLNAASSRGHDTIIQMLLKNGADLSAKCNITAFQKACKACSEHTIRILLEGGANVNPESNVFETGLMNASLRGHETIVQVLLESGADVNASDKYGKSALHYASANGDESIVRILLEHDADVNASNDKSDSVLQLASGGGHESTVRLLLEHDADVNASNTYGKSALHDAALAGHLSVVQLLLEHGADVNAKIDNDRSFLHSVYRRGYEPIVQTLIERGADINIRDEEQRTVLHFASLHGNVSVVQLLLEHGADVNARNSDKGETSLHVALQRKQTSTVRLLLEHEAHVNARDNQDRTPLHSVIGVGWGASEYNLQLLLDHGADINARESSGCSPLHLAAKIGRDSLMQMLLDRGADINARDNDDRTPLHSVSNSPWDNDSVVQLLLDYEADINAREISGRSPLHLAAAIGHESIVQMLLDRGADINARDNDGRTPLHSVSDSGWAIESVVPMLLERGADINARESSGWSPLHLVAKRGHGPIVELFLNHGADTNARDEYGRTSLHEASREGYGPIVQMLLDHGADINAQNIKGVNPLRSARRNGHDDIVRLLLQNAAADDEDEEIEWGNLFAEEEEDQSGEEDKDRSKDDIEDDSEAKTDEPDVRDDIVEA